MGMYVHKTPLPKSPADIMRSAYKLTKKVLSTTTTHHRLRRLLVIRQRWLQKASPPPGALIMQKRNVLAQYISGNGLRGLRPVSPPWWCVYAIVNLKSGRTYVVLDVALTYDSRNMLRRILTNLVVLYVITLRIL